MSSENPLHPSFRNGFDYLNRLIENNNLEALKEMIDCNVSFSPRSGQTCFQLPLVLACELGRLEVVTLLTEHKVQIDLDIDQFLEEDYWDEALTALMSASGHGHFQIVRTLIRAGADPNVKTCYGEPALGFAARNGHLDIFEELAPLTSLTPDHVELLRKLAKSKSEFVRRT